MASLRTTSASCLGCMARRTLTSAARPTTMTTAAAMASPAAASNPFLTIQTRGKKQYRNPDGVVVRLLEDVTRFGRKDTILRVARGRMRNKWYPDGTAEYVTGSRLSELGFKNVNDAIVPADTAFIARDKDADALRAARDVAAPVRPSITLKTVSAARAATLLETLLPAKLEFFRKPISADAQGIFGSVSSDDVATALREVLRGSQDDEDVMLLRIEARDVHFIIPTDEAPAPTPTPTPTQAPAPTESSAAAPAAPESEETSTADRIKSLGRWEVEITVRGSGVGSDSLASTAGSATLGGSGVPPIRRTVIVKAQED
ncbi:ribosomal protein l9 rnase h1 [Ophiostoma piceae UAMH 11346]|uniref:Ribosomal protein l9 rnase h1 n=1 Tax=Ophiostoma piceae (strain UAMH 11346) TaxID=1262450 RepID=S3CRJ6_OPHP1|nr:ribosomal protein l9 rnase h1 [Ophiostoma piceae UAMH 11346]